MVDHLGSPAETMDIMGLTDVQDGLVDLDRLVSWVMELIIDLTGHSLSDDVESAAADSRLMESHEPEFREVLARGFLHDLQGPRPLGPLVNRKRSEASRIKMATP